MYQGLEVMQKKGKEEGLLGVGIKRCYKECLEMKLERQIGNNYRVFEILDQGGDFILQKLKYYQRCFSKEYSDIGILGKLICV